MFNEQWKRAQWRRSAAGAGGFIAFAATFWFINPHMANVLAWIIAAEPSADLPILQSLALLWISISLAGTIGWSVFILFGSGLVVRQIVLLQPVLSINPVGAFIVGAGIGTSFVVVLPELFDAFGLTGMAEALRTRPGMVASVLIPALALATHRLIQGFLRGYSELRRELLERIQPNAKKSDNGEAEDETEAEGET